MAANGGIQHYYPASLIGQFSDRPRGKRRKRMVHVASWQANKVLYQPAEKLGFLSQFPHLYDDPSDAEVGLDHLWTSIERRIGVLDAATQRPWHRAIPASEFLGVWVPYVAQLVARAPHISEGLGHDLRTALHGSTAWSDRLVLYGRLVDSFTIGCRWSVIETSGEPFVSSDAGFVFLPTPTGGAICVPISPSRALFVERGAGIAARRVRIEHFMWSADSVAVLNECLVLAAGREVYASTRGQAATALALWRGEVDPVETRQGVNAAAFRMLFAQGAMAGFQYQTGHPAGVAYMEMCRALGVESSLPRPIAEIAARAKPSRDFRANMQILSALEASMSMAVKVTDDVWAHFTRQGVEAVNPTTFRARTIWHRDGPPVTTTG